MLTAYEMGQMFSGLWEPEPRRSAPAHLRVAKPTCCDCVAYGTGVGAAKHCWRRLSVCCTLVSTCGAHLVAGALLTEGLCRKSEHGALQGGPPVERSQHTLAVWHSTEEIATWVSELVTMLCHGAEDTMMIHQHPSFVLV